MINKPLTPEQLSKAQNSYKEWAIEEIQDRERSITETGKIELLQECHEELRGACNLTEALLDISFLDDKKIFDGLNEAFIFRMEYMAKTGLLMRNNVAQHLEDFNKICNLLRAVFVNRRSVIKMHSHYESNLFDIARLLNIDEENDAKERSNFEQRKTDHGSNKEALSE